MRRGRGTDSLDRSRAMPTVRARVRSGGNGPTNRVRRLAVVLCGWWQGCFEKICASFHLKNWKDQSDDLGKSSNVVLYTPMQTEAAQRITGSGHPDTSSAHQVPRANAQTLALPAPQCLQLRSSLPQCLVESTRIIREEPGIWLIRR